MAKKIVDREQKIIDFNKYADRCRKVERNFQEEVETKIISIDEVRERRKIMKKTLEKLVLEIHPYAITQMTGKDNRWCTAIKREGDKRRVVKKNTYEEIIDLLIEFYDVNNEKRKYTLRTMYPVWLRYKQTSTTKPSYIKRIHADWKRFYLNDPIIDIPLRQMTTNQISEWLNRKITVDGINKKKTFYNMITIFKNVFAYCYDENIVAENTFARARYRKDLLLQTVKPDSESQVFTEEERNLIVDYAKEAFLNNQEATSYLAIALLFQTGLRCGEVVALETTDYNKEEKTLSVTKGECRDFEMLDDGTMTYKGVFVGAPKKKGSMRTIDLTDEACEILDMVIEANKKNGVADGNYIFVYRNKRLQTKSIQNRIDAICEGVGISRRSSHKIRKTVLSELVNVCLAENICDVSKIREFAGHMDEGTLLKNYVFSTKGKEMNRLATKALQTKKFNETHNFPKAKEA